jgi:Asp-tRNA(Asn)/Glu-tRNA(Gln) amidotransferase C subunit
MMNFTKDQVRELAKAVSLEIPEDDLNNVALRLSTLLTAMEGIERELGPEMDRTEPIPPVYPSEEF